MMAATRPLATRFRDQSWKINLMLGTSLVFLGIGLFAPLVTLETFFIFSDTVSLASALWRLLQEGHLALFALLGTFSVLFPILKLALLAALWNFAEHDGQRYRKHLRWLAQYGKWSMLDVFVVAVLIAAAKSGGVASIQARAGLYAFAAAVILTSWTTSRVMAAIDSAEKNPH
jgi:paraquat-inducible protein A